MTNNTENLKAKLKEAGLTIDEVKEWLSSSESNTETYSSDSMAPQTSNVVFVPGNNTEETKVYVDDVKIEGLIRALLEYDSELNFPVLKLEILHPHIGMPRSCSGS